MDTLITKLAIENGLSVAFAVFVMAILFLIIKWLLKHIEDIQNTEKENRQHIFDMVDKHFLLIDELSKKIEIYQIDTNQSHSFQKKEHEEILKKLELFQQRM